MGVKESDVKRVRKEMGITPVYKMVDTCAAEFEAKTPYYNSSYDEEDEVIPSNREKVMVLGADLIE